MSRLSFFASQNSAWPEGLKSVAGAGVSRQTASRMVTINDVAKLAGVGRSSVSAVLSGKGDGPGTRVSSETRARIIAAGEQLGYRPSSSARAMRNGRFGCIGLLMSTQPSRSYVPKALLNGVHDELAAREMHLTLARLPDEKLTSEGFVPRILRELMTDGLLLDYISSIPQPMIDLIQRHRVPSIWINSKQSADCVYPDDFEAARRATRHLLSLGHRHITWVNFSAQRPEAHYSAHDRCRGFEHEMRAAGAQASVVWPDRDVARIDCVAYSIELIRRQPRPTAYLCYSARQCHSLLWAALSLGLRVPDDLSLMAFGRPDDDIALPMTMMLSPENAVGRQAVRSLLRKIEQPDEQQPAKAIEFGFQEGTTCRSI